MNRRKFLRAIGLGALIPFLPAFLVNAPMPPSLFSGDIVKLENNRLVPATWGDARGDTELHVWVEDGLVSLSDPNVTWPIERV